MIEQLSNDANGLRDLLVQTIEPSDPAKPDEITEREYSSCRSFLENFETIYTFNYDLLLYWARMHVSEDQTSNSDDGFRAPEDEYESSYVVWEPSQSHEQDMWYLHGALHIFDSGTEIQKYTWAKTGIRQIDQVRDALSKNLFPLFLSESTSKDKFELIRHSDYLAKAYRSFSEITGALFVYEYFLSQRTTTII